MSIVCYHRIAGVGSYKEDLDALRDYLPKLHQTLLMSATLTPEVESLKQLVLHKPAIVKVILPELAIYGEYQS